MLEQIYSSRGEAVMAKLPKIDKVEIKVRGLDHPPPHFHVITTDGEALVEIKTLRVLSGELPKRALWTLEWAAENRTTLIAEWNLRNPRYKTE
jgi:hypothetical protein